jgi:hypothetical protein
MRVVLTIICPLWINVSLSDLIHTLHNDPWSIPSSFSVILILTQYTTILTYWFPGGIYSSSDERIHWFLSLLSRRDNILFWLLTYIMIFFKFFSRWYCFSLLLFPPPVLSLSISTILCSAAVGAYVSMVLEGFLNSSAPPYPLTSALKPYVGMYKSNVHCYALGAPPCVSRNIVPRFITSVLNGDDLIPRVSPGSIENVQERVLKALKAGAGGKIALGWKLGLGRFADLGSVAGSLVCHFTVLALICSYRNIWLNVLITGSSFLTTYTCQCSSYVVCRVPR